MDTNSRCRQRGHIAQKRSAMLCVIQPLVAGIPKQAAHRSAWQVLPCFTHLLSPRYQRSFATFIVDGGKDSKFVRKRLQHLSKEHEEGIDILAVGQNGIFVALSTMAELQCPKGTPTFMVAALQSEEIQSHAPEGYRIDGKNNYRLVLAAASTWENKSHWQNDSRLLVGNGTTVMPLAKAIAARVKLLPEGKSVAVETALLGNVQPRNLRVSRLAHALARAHQWQMNPVDAKRPTRPFRCFAEFVSGDAPHDETKQDGVRSFLRVEVLPEGPPGGFLPGSKPDSKATKL